MIDYHLFNCEYHHSEKYSDYVSKSVLDAIHNGPAYYEWWLQKPIDETAEALVMGSAIHSAVLEPDVFRNDYAVAPALDRRTKQGREDYEIFLRQAYDNDQIVLTSEQNELITECKNSVFAHPTASKLLSTGNAEVSIFNEAEKLKIRPDWLIVNEDKKEIICVDLKTYTKGLKNDLADKVYDYRYHVQDAMYLDVLRKEFGDSFSYKFYFIFVDKGTSHEVSVVELPESFRKLGYDTYKADLQLFHNYQANPAIAREDIQLLDIPYRVASQINENLEWN